MFKRVIAALSSVAGLLLVTGATASPIATGTWYLGVFTEQGGPVFNLGAGGGASDPGAPAWTFTIADAHVLTVIDCCGGNDRFDVFDGATNLGTTAEGTTQVGCFTADGCDTFPGAGRGDFDLAAGSYSITMTVSQFSGQPSNLFFILRPTPGGGGAPEPGSLLLVAAALLGTAFVRRRRPRT